MSRKRTGKVCVAAGCTATHKDKLSLHEFPKDGRPDIRRQRITFVKTKRKDFINPSAHSVLCEKQFTPDCYPVEYTIKKTMGMVVKKKSLLPDAVPTIHLVGGVEKITGCKRPASQSSDSLAGPSQPKKMRSAYRKRACTRVVKSHHQPVDVNGPSAVKSTDVDTCDNSLNDTCTEVVLRSVGIQSSGKSVQKRSKICQTKLKTADKVAVIQVEIRKGPKMTLFGVQCNRDIEEAHRRIKKYELVKGKSSQLGDDIHQVPMCEPEQTRFFEPFSETDPDFNPNSEDDCISEISSLNESQVLYTITF